MYACEQISLPLSIRLGSIGFAESNAGNNYNYLETLMNKGKTAARTRRSTGHGTNFTGRLFGEENLEFTGTVIKKAGKTQVYFPGIKDELKNRVS